MRQQEEARRLAAERERTKARLIQAELHRIEERVRLRREAERKRIVEERARTLAEMRERDEKLRARRPERMSLELWEQYEARWAGITASSDPLKFSDIPWPITSPSPSLESMTIETIRLFFLSASHSKNLTRKERIRSAQLRWHPDRFQRLMSRVVEQDKTAVEACVGAIARCLNEMMEQEKGGRMSGKR
jgi:hypothetical protein